MTADGPPLPPLACRRGGTRQSQAGCGRGATVAQRHTAGNGASGRGAGARRRDRTKKRTPAGAGVPLAQLLRGAGQYAVQGVLNSDIYPVLGFVLFSAIFSLIVYIAVDLVYFLLDPRISN